MSSRQERDTARGRRSSAVRCFVASARASLGVRPNLARKRRAKWAWLENPHRCATSAILPAPRARRVPGAPGQPPFRDVPRRRAAGRLEDPPQMPYRDAHDAGHLSSPETGIVQMPVDVVLRHDELRAIGVGRPSSRALLGESPEQVEHALLRVGETVRAATGRGRSAEERTQRRHERALPRRTPPEQHRPGQPASRARPLEQITGHVHQELTHRGGEPEQIRPARVVDAQLARRGREAAVLVQEHRLPLEQQGREHRVLGRRPDGLRAALDDVGVAGDLGEAQLAQLDVGLPGQQAPLGIGGAGQAHQCPAVVVLPVVDAFGGCAVLGGGPGDHGEGGHTASARSCVSGPSA